MIAAPFPLAADAASLLEGDASHPDFIRQWEVYSYIRTISLPIY
jgi:hypothetical protein